MFTMTICDYPVAIMPAETVHESYIEFAIASKIFQEWIDSLDSRFKVSSIRIQAVDFKGRNPSKETVMFIRMRVSAANALFSQIVELRGGTVILLPVLRCGMETYTVLVQQPRLPSGDFQLLEVPAGMVDDGTFKGAAAKEMQEELGLIFTEDEMVRLSKEDILLSPGLLDEHARVYMASRIVTTDELFSLQGKATGLVEEGESITLKVIPLASLALETRDGKALIALALYNRYLDDFELEDLV